MSINTQIIHDCARRDFDILSNLLIHAKRASADSEKWPALNHLLDDVCRYARIISMRHNVDVLYLDLHAKTHQLTGYIFALNLLDKRDDELNKAKIRAYGFGSWQAFEPRTSRVYFDVFIPLLAEFVAKNPDIFN